MGAWFTILTTDRVVMISGLEREKRIPVDRARMERMMNSRMKERRRMRVEWSGVTKGVMVGLPSISSVGKDHQVFCEEEQERSGEMKELFGDKNIVFVGMMGSGKSTLGRLVAKRLELKFVDSDREIEKASGYGVGELIENYGIEFFRDRESKVIGRLLSSGGGKVLALGGGSMTTSEVRTAVKDMGLSVWLRVDEEVLCHRLEKSPKRRPLLESEGESLREIVSRLLEERASYYGCADMEFFMGEKDDLEACTEKLVTMLRTHMEGGEGEKVLGEFPD
jgi:shikimate kinase